VNLAVLQGFSGFGGEGLSVAYRPVLVLVGLLIASWRAERHYQARQLQQERSEHARERFSFDPLPASKLRPEDLNFHVEESGEPELEVTLAQVERPFHEHAYIGRRAISTTCVIRKMPNPNS
jgi:hypothetical protein